MQNAKMSKTFPPAHQKTIHNMLDWARQTSNVFFSSRAKKSWQSFGHFLIIFKGFWRTRSKTSKIKSQTTLNVKQWFYKLTTHKAWFWSLIVVCQMTNPLYNMDIYTITFLKSLESSRRIFENWKASKQ